MFRCNHPEPLAARLPREVSGLGVWVVIPALNEEASLPLVLRDLPPVDRVIVVDNGSTDRTAEVALSTSADVVNERERGYGAACLAGLRWIDRLVDSGVSVPKVVVFLDADFSDHPEELPKLVEPILRGEADFVLGSRLLGSREPGAMPAHAVWGNRLACGLMRLFWGARYSDLGPFRAIAWTAIQDLSMEDRGYGWTLEMQVKAARRALRTREVPVRYRRRTGRSKISGTLGGSVRAGSKILCLIGRYAWQTWRSP